MAVVDGAGRRAPASARFLGQFAHGLYPPLQRPGPGSDGERARLGEIARLRPGRSVPLTVSWRRARPASPPVAVDLGQVTIPVPSR